MLRCLFAPTVVLGLVSYRVRFDGWSPVCAMHRRGYPEFRHGAWPLENRDVNGVEGLQLVTLIVGRLLKGKTPLRLAEAAFVGWNSVSFSSRAALLSLHSYTIRYEVGSAWPWFLLCIIAARGYARTPRRGNSQGFPGGVVR
jgi:hypothetical protein